MVERKLITLAYQYNEKWIGGTYYLLNIIRALNHLPDSDKPSLKIFYSTNTSIKDLEDIKYPYIELHAFNFNFSFIEKVINKLSLLILNKEIITKKLPGLIENFYYRSFSISNRNIEKYYCWIADLQDLYLPHFFSPKEISARMETYKRLIEQREPIVFSSKAALNDFNKFYPNNKNTKRVLNFVSISHSSFKELSFSNLKDKFNITKDFFIISNQFWKHKNHQVALDAFKQILAKHPDLQLVLTGKEHDYRDPGHINLLKEYVKSNNLQNKILFLGFIAREEQLKLMSESIAIIQPSLFEGWSTVVEDAKSLNKPIICSDIPVHREQLLGSNLFFNPQEPNSLADLMDCVIKNEYTFDSSYNSEEAIFRFATEFVNLFK